MAVMTYLGLGDGAPEDIARGRRRVVTYTSFLIFVLVTAAANAADWIKGGLEVMPEALPPGSQPTCAIGCDGNTEYARVPKAHGRALQQSPQFGLYFDIGLQAVTLGQSQYRSVIGANLDSSCAYDRSAYVNIINACTSSPNCTTTRGCGLWCGIQPLKQSTFSATFGLLVFSAVLSCAAWLGMAGVQAGVPQLTTAKYTYHVLSGLHGATAFFTMIAVAVFGASTVKSEFCSVFEPNDYFSSLPCQYSNGFNAAITGLVFAILNTALSLRWMPWTSVAPKYELTASATGYAGIEPSAATAFTGGGASSSSGSDTLANKAAYQDL